jgi:predicted 3-demethylubiquinone-9 3-methyltransferase (glyoxalase superfamily)
MPPTVRTCLWFDRNGLEAAEFYVGLIPDSRIDALFTPAPDAPPLVIDFTLGGTAYQILNAERREAHTEATSISVTTPDQAETDRIWDALLADGGQPVACGWCRDRFGVSWQIVPEPFMRLMGSPDREKAGRAMAAMMQMVKLDIAALQAAYDGTA